MVSQTSTKRLLFIFGCDGPPIASTLPQNSGIETINMEPQPNATIIEPSRKTLFDYSNVLTIFVGKGDGQSWFTLDLPQFCQESACFNDRLTGDSREARNRHIAFRNANVAAVRCMIHWYRGWDCTLCGNEPHHIIDGYLLAEKYCIIRFKEHLIGKMQIYLERPASNIVKLSHIVHLYRGNKGTSHLLELLLKHITTTPGPSLPRAWMTEPSYRKHLQDLLALEGEEVEELKATLRLTDPEVQLLLSEEYEEQEYIDANYSWTVLGPGG